MKTRLGFVSNSSSCSFLIHGTAIEHGDWDKIEEAVTKLKLKDIEISDGGSDGYYIYVGIDFTNMNPTETRIEFEARAQNSVDYIMDELNLPRVKCGIEEAAWRDG